MKRRRPLMILLVIGAAISFSFFVHLVAHAGHQVGGMNDQVFSAKASTDQLVSHAQSIRLAKDNGENDKGTGKVSNGDKSDKPDLRYVDWSKSPSVQKNGGNGNGEGEDEEEEGEDEEEDEEEEEEGFDRQWDVVLYG